MVALIYLGDEKLACNLLNKPSSGFKYPGGPGAAPPGRRWAAAKPLRAPSRFPRIPTEVGKRKWEVASISLQTAPSFTELTLTVSSAVNCWILSTTQSAPGPLEASSPNGRSGWPKHA